MGRLAAKRLSFTVLSPILAVGAIHCGTMTGAAMSSLAVRPLEKNDHSEWRRLWTAYLTFYKASAQEEVYATTWKRLFAEGEYEPRGFIALVDGRPAGLVHYLYHRTCWSQANNCYLQDLFADPDIRGRGVGAALIEAVRQAAAKDGITNVYWLTHETNTTARRLYDRVAKFTGFIKYSLQ
jgi:GNAT superfamily N-acetyltransferase